jgi:hypothetical protein
LIRLAGVRLGTLVERAIAAIDVRLRIGKAESRLIVLMRRPLAALAVATTLLIVSAVIVIPGRRLGDLGLGGRNDPIVVLGVLKQALTLNAIAGHLSITGELGVLVSNMKGRTADLYFRSVALIGAR